MKKYFVFAGDDDEGLYANQHIGMADTPEEAIKLYADSGCDYFQLFELIDGKLTEASGASPMTDTVPHPEYPDNANRRMLVYYLKMKDGTRYEIEREYQVAIKPIPPWFPVSGSLTVGSVTVTGVIASVIWRRETDDRPSSDAPLYITFGTPKTGN